MWLPLVRSQICLTIYNRCYSRLSEQELLVPCRVLVPATEEYGLQTIDHTRLLSESIDCVWPELGNKLDDRVSAVHDPAMGTIVDGEMERLRRRLLLGA